MIFHSDNFDSLAQIDKREVARSLMRSHQTIYNWQNLAIEILDDFAKAVVYQAQNHDGKFNVYQY